MPVNATAGQLGLNLGLGRQNAVERRARELMEQGLGRQEALRQARAELSGRSLGLPLGEEGAAVDLEGLRTGEVAAGDTEDEDFVFGKEFPALSRDLPRPGAEVPSPITYDDDSSLADQDRVAAKAVTEAPAAPGGGPTGGITLPPEPEVGGRPETVARILEVLGGIGAGIGKSRGIGKANKLTAQRQALSNLVNTLRGSATTGVAREEPRAGLLQTLGAGLGAGAKSFREGRGLGREERNIAAQQGFVNERLLREDERAQAQRDRLAGFREREVGLKETAAELKTPPKAGAPITREFPDGTLRQWDEVGKKWDVIGDATPPKPGAPHVRNFTDDTTRQYNQETGVWEVLSEGPDRGDRTSATGLSLLTEAQSFRSELDALDKLLSDVTFSGAGSRFLDSFLSVDFLPDIPEGGGRPSFGLFEGLIADTFPGDSRFRARLERLTVSFARMANGGRPSDPDRFATMFDLPIATEKRETQQAKINSLKEISEWREVLLRENFNVPIGGYLETGEDGIQRLNTNKLQQDMGNRFLTADVKSWLQADIDDPETSEDRRAEIRALLFGPPKSLQEDDGSGEQVELNAADYE